MKGIDEEEDDMTTRRSTPVAPASEADKQTSDPYIAAAIRGLLQLSSPAKVE